MYTVSALRLRFFCFIFFFFQAEDGIRDADVTGVQTCALPISSARRHRVRALLRHVRGEGPRRRPARTARAAAARDAKLTGGGVRNPSRAPPPPPPAGASGSVRRPSGTARGGFFPSPPIAPRPRGYTSRAYRQ